MMLTSEQEANSPLQHATLTKEEQFKQLMLSRANSKKFKTKSVHLRPKQSGVPSQAPAQQQLKKACTNDEARLHQQWINSFQDFEINNRLSNKQISLENMVQYISYKISKQETFSKFMQNQTNRQKCEQLLTLNKINISYNNNSVKTIKHKLNQHFTKHQSQTLDAESDYYAQGKGLPNCRQEEALKAAPAEDQRSQEHALESSREDIYKRSCKFFKN